MKITLDSMTAAQRAAFVAHCQRTRETPAAKLKRLNSILAGGKRKQAS